MNNLELIHDLIRQTKEVTYNNGTLDAVKKRSEMLLRKIFGEKTHYLESLKSISFSPAFWTANTPASVFEHNFNIGIIQLLNLLNVIAEDLQLDSAINEPKAITNNIQQDSKNVFVVHGHNEEMKQSVARTLEKLKLKAIILHEQPNKGKTIIEKFTDHSDVSYAVVLLSADDIAYSKNEKPESARLRARQNVIFELGYFIGKLGRERVLALHEVNENLEIPSDYQGLVFVPFDKTGKWQFDLERELKEVGINVDANSIL